MARTGGRPAAAAAAHNHACSRSFFLPGFRDTTCVRRAAQPADMSNWRHCYWNPHVNHQATTDCCTSWSALTAPLHAASSSTTEHGAHCSLKTCQ
ncbi:hypothetical protein ElyMa_001126200 [Elysia marginata]|uniref:Secreted protein n=1 Tax=Elysia marginata TaxID=1093978 RepID=A0AAV4I0P3_9GAST|nr:hypothetical protein ElyMa_001126200 [Elysia marginata]